MANAGTPVRPLSTPSKHVCHGCANAVPVYQPLRVGDMGVFSVAFQDLRIGFAGSRLLISSPPPRRRLVWDMVHGRLFNPRAEEGSRLDANQRTQRRLVNYSAAKRRLPQMTQYKVSRAGTCAKLQNRQTSGRLRCSPRTHQESLRRHGQNVT